MTLRLYLADIELHGVLIFATEQRPSLSDEGGAIITTGYYIHNYPLIYAMNGRPVEAYPVIPSLHFLSYRDLRKSSFVSSLARQPLRYTFIEEQLKNLLEGRESIYVFPAYPERIVTKKFFMQALGTGYAEFRGRLKTVYPRLEHYVALIPPSRFRTIVISTRDLPSTMFIRLGMKRMGLLKVRLRSAEIVKRLREPTWSTVPVNLYDVEMFGYNLLDIAKVMETRSRPENRPLASVVAYVRAENHFLIRAEKEEHRAPLPLKLIEREKRL